MRGIGLALLSALLFGAATPVSKVLLERLGTFQLAGLLYLGAALGVLPLLWREREPSAGRLDRRNRIRLAGAVILGGVIGPVLLLQALRLTLAASVSLLLNLELAATAVLGVVLFREHLGRLGWTGVAGVVAAGAVVTWGAGWPGWLAALLVAGACLCWGADNHFTALIDGMTPARCTLWKGLVAGTANLILGLAVEPLSFGPSSITAAALVGSLSYGASITLYIMASHQLGATRAQAYFASAPFLGAALAFGMLGEPLQIGHLVGAAVLAVSALLLAFSRHDHLHTHETTWHIHSHRHDDGHHFHEHPGLPASTRHTHWHRHEPVTHSHPHWPDLHHRHRHPSRPPEGDSLPRRTSTATVDRNPGGNEMRIQRVLAGSAVLLLCCTSPEPQTEPSAVIAEPSAGFVGAWKLVSVERRSADGELIPTESQPTGFIMYDPAGYMGVVIQGSARQPYADRRRTPEEALSAIRSYTSYFGKYSVDAENGVVTHHLVASLNPSWTGSDQRRHYRFADNRLTLQPPTGPSGNTVSLTWERLPDLAELTPEHRRFIGFWSFVEIARTDETGASVPIDNPFDGGYIIYTASGHMAVHLTRPGRAPYEGTTPTPEEADAAMSTYFSYFGPYSIHPDDGYVVHHRTGSTNPGTVGTDAQRYYELSDRHLILKPPATTTDGRTLQSALTWERLSDG